MYCLQLSRHALERCTRRPIHQGHEKRLRRHRQCFGDGANLECSGFWRKLDTPMRHKATIRHVRFRKRTDIQSGVTILETLIAMSVLLVVSVGILAMGMVAMTTTENQGHRAARTAEYAQDKAEQLLSLAYKDSSSDTTVFPTANGGGSGLTVGGSSDPNAPVGQYVDYLDTNGNLLASGGG